MDDDQDKIEYLDIQLTDITLHSNKLNNPKAWERTVQKTRRSHKPGRLYGKFLRMDKDGTMVLEPPKEMIGKNGKKIVIRAHMPKGGVPIYAGDDLIEKIKAVKKKEDKVRVLKPDHK